MSDDGLPMRVPVAAEVIVRLAEPRDLDALSWFGMFAHHRPVLEAAFARHARGENLILLATLGDFPVGQIFVDLVRRREERAGYLWALRVFPFLQGLGLGRLLMEASERLLRARGCVAVELGVEHDNARAQGLYERLGYVRCGRVVEESRYAGDDGAEVVEVYDQIVMRKSLDAGSSSGRGRREPREPT